MMTLEGTVTIRPFWGGAGLWEEIEADGPNGHWQGMTVFLYNPKSGQWSQRFANAAEGRFSPAMFGGFKHGRGELYSQDSYQGRAMQVRAVWSDITPNSHTYQGFDGYLVFDTRVQYRLDKNWVASVGIDNIGNDKYFLFHPFPQRTYLMEIHYAQ